MSCFLKARRTFMTSSSSSSTSRTFSVLSAISGFPLGFGPRYPESRTGNSARFDPRASVICFHDLLYNGQADACPFTLAGCVQPLEHHPDALVKARIDARAVVAHV